jgi:hypothetical protein
MDELDMTHNPETCPICNEEPVEKYEPYFPDVTLEAFQAERINELEQQIGEITTGLQDLVLMNDRLQALIETQQSLLRLADLIIKAAAV